MYIFYFNIKYINKTYIKFYITNISLIYTNFIYDYSQFYNSIYLIINYKIKTILALNIIKNLIQNILILYYFIPIHFIVRLFSITWFFFILSIINIYKLFSKFIYFVYLIIYKLFICIMTSISLKIMLYLSEKEKYYFFKYPFIRRSRRLINVFLRYFRLHSRYLIWNCCQQIFSWLFSLFKLLIYILIYSPLIFLYFLKTSIFLTLIVPKILYNYCVTTLISLFINLIIYFTKLVKYIIRLINKLISVVTQ